MLGPRLCSRCWDRAYVARKKMRVSLCVHHIITDSPLNAIFPMSSDLLKSISPFSIAMEHIVGHVEWC